MDLGSVVALIVGILGAGVSLTGILISAKTTRDTVTSKLDVNQQLTANEIIHIKADMAEMKSDIKSHNHYAQLFNENVPVIKEQTKNLSQRVDRLEAEMHDHQR